MKQLHNQIQIKVSARSSFSGKIIGFSSITAQWWWMWEQAETWCVTTNHTDSFPVRRKEEKATYFLSLGGNGNHQQYFVLHIASVLLYLPEKYHCDYISQNLHWSGVYCDPIFSSSFSMSTSSSIYSKNYFQLRQIHPLLDQLSEVFLHLEVPVGPTQQSWSLGEKIV